MEWIKIDKDNLPENEVLAGNFGAGTYGYKEKIVGYLSYDKEYDCIICSATGEELGNCTHYIDIHEHDIN